MAIGIGRQRLLTSQFDYFQLRNDTLGPSAGFQCTSIPHITLSSISNNANLEPILSRHAEQLEELLKHCNEALSSITQDSRSGLKLKLIKLQKSKGKRAVTEGDLRRWALPKRGDKWEHWEIPFDTDPDWTKPLQDAVIAYRKAWRAKMDEVNACIAANADQEELVDQPEIVKGVWKHFLFEQLKSYVESGKHLND